MIKIKMRKTNKQKTVKCYKMEIVINNIGVQYKKMIHKSIN